MIIVEPINKANYQLKTLTAGVCTFILSITETWIDAEKDLELDGCELLHTDQQNKGGGGVSIYVTQIWTSGFWT